MSVGELLSPKQVAVAIGVSESSLKRWCDRGVLPTVRTVGGHRRIPMSGVLKFLQQSGQPLVQPEILGLPRLERRTDRTSAEAVQQLCDGLVTGQEELCRRVLFELYLNGREISAICDDVIKPTFVKIGDQWECGRVEVYQERTACEIAQRVLTEFRLAWSTPSPQAPLAIGGTLAGDWYRLPTSMCELVLLDAGWNAISMGTDLPFETWHAALEARKPQLLWVSVSYVHNREQFLTQYPALFDHAQRLGIPVVLGGQAFDDSLRSLVRFTTFCDNMRELESFASSWKKSHEVDQSPPEPDAKRLAM